MNKNMDIFKNSKSIINDLYLIFSDIKINAEEKKILYPFLQSKLKTIYKKIIKKKSIFKKVDDYFLILLNNYIEKLNTSKKQYGGLQLNVNERRLIDYIIFDEKKNEDNIIILLKKCINFFKIYDKKDFFLLKITKR